MLKIGLFIFLLTWLCLMKNTFADEIKTIGGDIIEGEVIDVDEEYLSIRQGVDHIYFIQWDIIELISRDKEIIVVNHVAGERKFSIFTTTTGTFSAKDIRFESTDNIKDIYPEKSIANRPLFLIEREQSPQGVTNISLSSPRQDTPDAPQQKKPWRGNVDAGLTIQKGNKEALTTNVKADLSWERTKGNIYFNGILLLETNDGEKNVDEQRGTLKYERKHTERLYSFYQESIEHDEIEQVNLRSISSLGIGYRFIDGENVKYKSEIGPSFTYERFRDNIIQTNPGLRIGNYLDWQIRPKTLFYFKVDFLPVPGDIEDWRLESDVGLRHGLTKSLSLNLNWINEYDNKPGVENVSKNDATILSTIGYNF